MKRLAYWASQHIWRSWLLVFLCYALINWLGIFWAVVLLSHGLQAPGLFPLLPCIATLAAWFFYPKHSPHFIRRKICDTAFAISSLAFVVYGTTEAMHPASQRMTASASMMRPRVESNKRPSGAEGSRHGFGGFLHEAARRYQDMSLAGKILLITLAVVVTAAVIVLWGAICCEIVCSGTEALGYVLFFAGAAGAIFGCVRIIQRIVRGPRNRRTIAY